MYTSRLDMAKAYDDLMNRTQETRRQVKRNRSDENLIKTYVIELHSSERELGNKEHLMNKLSLFSQATNSALVTTDDWLFYGIRCGSLDFYMEVPDPRFMLLHTHAKAEQADQFFAMAATAAPFIDHAWLPSDFLEGLSRLGTLRGFKLRNDDSLALRRGEPDRDQLMRKLSLSLSLTENVEQTLQELKQVTALRHALNLSGVELRVGEDLGRRYALDEVYHDGKITARGSSFTAHHDLAVDLCLKYGNKIRQVEDSCSVLVSVTESGFAIEGLPFELLVDPPIDDVDSFCRNLLSGNKPFRLWGVPEYLTEDYITVKAVDLHGGQKLYLEISPELIRLYLPRDTCGNTVYRLITSLQQHLARTIQVTHGGDDFDLGIGHI